MDTDRTYSWEELIKKYLAARKQELKPSTYNIYKVIISHTATRLTEKGVTPEAFTLEDIFS